MGKETDGTRTGRDALADPRRRQVVDALSERQPPVSLGELADAVDGRGETGAGPGGATVDDRALMARSNAVSAPKRGLSTAATLYHVHLPKLDDAGVLTFDHESKEVRDWDPGALPPDGVGDAAGR